MNWYQNPYGIEGEIRFSNYKYLKEKYKALGYSSATEAIIDLYQIHSSTIKVGKLLDLSKSTVALKLKAFGCEMNPKGGANNPYGRAGKPCEL